MRVMKELPGSSARRTWETRELPVLQAIRDQEDAGRRIYLSSQLGEALGLTAEETINTFRGLHEAGYITAAPKALQGPNYVNPRLLERGRREIGQWPADNAYDDFLAILQVRILAAPEDERDRLERLRDAVIGVGRDVATAVLTELGTRVLSGKL